MKKKFIKKKKKLIKNLNINKKENFDQNPKKLIQKKDYNIFNNENDYYNPFPSYANLLDNYNYIQYRNIKIPRISISNGYHFDDYQKPFNDLFEKINHEYKNMRDYFLTILNITNQNGNYKKESNNINNIQLRNNDIIIDIKDDNEDVEKLSLLEKTHIETQILNKEIRDKLENIKTLDKKPKMFKNIFKLYDQNKNLICKKRGKKPLNNNRIHIHSALDNDNILRKIQVHFFTFLVYFTNDYIDTLYEKSKKKQIPHFKSIDYKVKIKISQNSIEKLKTLTIGEILQNKASPKNKLCDKNINFITYIKLCEDFPQLKENYFNRLFKQFFIEYYYNKNEKAILINGLYVKLSNKTEGFNKLIQKNSNYIEKYRNIAACFYKNNIDENSEERKQIIQIKNQTEIINKPLFIIDN